MGPRLGRPKPPLLPTGLLALLAAGDVFFGAGVVSKLPSWTARDFGIVVLFNALLGVSVAVALSVVRAWRDWLWGRVR